MSSTRDEVRSYITLLNMHVKHAQDTSHVNGNITFAYGSHAQVDKTKAHWVYYFVTAVDSHMSGTDEVATVPASAGVTKQAGEPLEVARPNTEASNLAETELVVVQCDILKLLKHLPEGLRESNGETRQ